MQLLDERAGVEVCADEELIGVAADAAPDSGVLRAGGARGENEGSDQGCQGELALDARARE